MAKTVQWSQLVNQADRERNKPTVAYKFGKREFFNKKNPYDTTDTQEYLTFGAETLTFGDEKLTFDDRASECPGVRW